MTKWVDLPQEIIDIIFQYLDELSDVKNFALVNKVNYTVYREHPNIRYATKYDKLNTVNKFFYKDKELITANDLYRVIKEKYLVIKSFSSRVLISVKHIRIHTLSDADFNINVFPNLTKITCEVTNVALPKTVTILETTSMNMQKITHWSLLKLTVSSINCKITLDPKIKYLCAFMSSIDNIVNRQDLCHLETLLTCQNAKFIAISQNILSTIPSSLTHLEIDKYSCALPNTLQHLELIVNSQIYFNDDLKSLVNLKTLKLTVSKCETIYLSNKYIKKLIIIIQSLEMCDCHFDFPSLRSVAFELNNGCQKKFNGFLRMMEKYTELNHVSIDVKINHSSDIFFFPNLTIDSWSFHSDINLITEKSVHYCLETNFKWNNGAITRNVNHILFDLPTIERLSIYSLKNIKIICPKIEFLLIRSQNSKITLDMKNKHINRITLIDCDCDLSKLNTNMFTLSGNKKTTYNLPNKYTKLILENVIITPIMIIDTLKSLTIINCTVSETLDLTYVTKFKTDMMSPFFILDRKKLKSVSPIVYFD